MAEYGLGNFKYEFTVEGGSAKFKFYDEQDASNTAETSVSTKDFPEGVTQPDSRQVADVAYNQVSKVLNDKRDARLRQTADNELADKQTEDSRQREAAEDLHANSQDVSTAPTKVDSDGTNVYNTASLLEVDSKDSKNDKKK